MAPKHFPRWIFPLILLEVNKLSADNVNSTKNTTIENEEIDLKIHLSNPKVIELCKKRDEFCRTNGTDVNLCTYRKLNNNETYKDVVNSCYLFFSNMCDNPGEEFYIVSGGSCADYFSMQGKDKTSEIPNNSTANVTNSVINTSQKKIVNESSILRYKFQQFNRPKPNVSVALTEAYDGHLCPKSCITVYKPQCLGVNREREGHYKMFHFINHCNADLFYCTYPEEFKPPPGSDVEMVTSSTMSWSPCGRLRYLLFHRFSEMGSIMGHYGWLDGKQPFRHIMEPHERRPGFG